MTEEKKDMSKHDWEATRKGVYLGFKRNVGHVISITAEEGANINRAAKDDPSQPTWEKVKE